MLTIRKRAASRESESPFDRRGFQRAPVTYRTYRLGKPAPNRGRTFPPEPLTPEEVYALLRACRPGSGHRTETVIRNRALIMVLWRCGLRIAEALALEPKDVDLARGTVAVLRGKGQKRRTVFIDRGAGGVLEQWLRAREILEIGGGPLFCVVEGASRGARMHSSVVRETLKDLAGKAGIEKRVHPHGLRHSYASYLLDQGVPIHFIKRMLGHSSIAITEHYADHINPARVLEEMARVEWPAHLGRPVPEVAE